MIADNFGEEITVKFRKRSSGEIRKMRFKQGVSDGVKKNPKRPGLDFEEYGLLPVFDLDIEEYRAIPIEGLIAIKLQKGKWIKVKKGVKKASK